MTIKAPPPPPPPQEDDSLDALYDLAAEGEQHARNQQLAPRCPGCRSEMAPGAVLCTHCGYDTRTGKSIATAAPAQAPAAPGTRYDPAKAAVAAAEATRKKKSAGTDKMAPQESYLKGLAGCVAGAAIGGVLWFLIAYFTGYEVYFVLLLVAILAGLGMQRGQQGYSYLGGFTAAGVTFVTMILARLAVVVALIVPMMRHDAARKLADKAAMRMPDLTMYDPRVVDQLHAEQLKQQTPPAARAETDAAAADSTSDDEGDGDEATDHKPSASELRDIAAYQAVEKRLKQMPKSEYDAMVARLDRQERDERLEGYLTDDILINEMHYHPDNAGEVLYGQANKTAKERIAKMNDAQRTAEYKRLDAAAAKEREKQLAELRAEMKKRADRGEGQISSGAVAAVTGIVILFLVFGGLKGAFWTLCALGLAYRTASGSVGG
jgi:hypothetical protein